jgi:hypothetical protein
MDAATIQGIYSGISAVSGAASAFSQYQKGVAERDAYNYNANATIMKMNQEIAASSSNFSRLMGRQRSLYAKAGVDISSGSPLLVLADTAMQGAEEAERIKLSGESGAAIQRWSGETAAYAGKIGGISTFLTSLGTAAQKYRFGMSGANPGYNLKKD